MSPRGLSLLAGALALAACGRPGVEQTEPSTITTGQPIKAQVLVARRDIPAGAFLGAEHLCWQGWPDDGRLADYLVKGLIEPDELYGLHGSILREGLTAGLPLRVGQLVKPVDEAFLAAVMKPGRRAFVLKFFDNLRIARLVFPGDRVDVILTYTASNPERSVSVTVLADVRLLAAEKLRESDDVQFARRVIFEKFATIESLITELRDTPLPEAEMFFFRSFISNPKSSAILELTPGQARILAQAARAGELSIAMKGPPKRRYLAQTYPDCAESA